MTMVCVQHRHQRWPFLNDPDTCMAMTMNSSLVAFGQPEAPLQIEIVLNLGKLIAASEETNQEAHHDLTYADEWHRQSSRILAQPLEFPSSVAGNSLS